MFSPLSSYLQNHGVNRAIFPPRLRTSLACSSASTVTFERSWSTQFPTIKAIDGVSHSLFKGEVRGLGLKGSDDIPEGEEVIRLPLERCLIVSEADIDIEEKPSDVSESFWKSLPGTTRLSFLLLQEYDKGENSQLHTYINNLPAPGELNTLVHWSEQEILCLKKSYPPIANLVTKQSDNYKGIYDKMQQQSSTNNIYKDIDLERFIWACESVTSRAFQGVGGLKNKESIQIGLIVAAASIASALALANVGEMGTFREPLALGLGTIGGLALMPAVLNSASDNEKCCCLLPAIDSCNHRSQGYNSEMAFETTSNAFVLRNTQRMEGLDSESEPSELTISYGARHNDDLLQYFGFVEGDNPNDIYRIVVDLQARHQGLDSVGLQSGMRIIVSKRKDRKDWVVPGGITDAALKALLEEEMKCVKVADSTNLEKKRKVLLDSFLSEKVKVLKEASVLM